MASSYRFSRVVPNQHLLTRFVSWIPDCQIQRRVHLPASDPQAPNGLTFLLPSPSVEATTMPLGTCPVVPPLLQISHLLAFQMFWDSSLSLSQWCHLTWASSPWSEWCLSLLVDLLTSSLPLSSASPFTCPSEFSAVHLGHSTLCSVLHGPLGL